MAPSRLTSEDLQNVHDLAAPWGKIVARRSFGEEGPGLDVGFAALEEVAAAAARGLTEGTLQCLLEQHAQRKVPALAAVKGDPIIIKSDGLPPPTSGASQ